MPTGYGYPPPSGSILDELGHGRPARRSDVTAPPAEPEAGVRGGSCRPGECIDIRARCSADCPVAPNVREHLAAAADWARDLEQAQEARAANHQAREIVGTMRLLCDALESVLGEGEANA